MNTDYGRYTVRRKTHHHSFGIYRKSFECKVTPPPPCLLFVRLFIYFVTIIHDTSFVYPTVFPVPSSNLFQREFYTPSPTLGFGPSSDPFLQVGRPSRSCPQYSDVSRQNELLLFLTSHRPRSTVHCLYTS